MSGRRRWAGLLAYGAVFVAGGLAWEVVRLGTMNRADRQDLVDQMIDAKRRADPVDHNVRRVTTSPTPRDILEEKVANEFERCAGRRPTFFERSSPIIDVEVLVREHEQWREDGRRSEMAYTNNVYRLRRVQLCRLFGGCGPDLPPSIKTASAATPACETEVERTDYWPTTWASAEPFALSLACGMGLREKQGLPSYPNEARLVREEQQAKADSTRPCAKGSQIACP